jgi:dolichol-phosphate mannosyltransferase
VSAPPAAGAVWVVVPTYDEAENVVALVRAALAALEGAGREARVLVVDDASPDGTADLAEALARDDPRVAVLRRPAKQGIGPAYRAGFRRALAEGAALVVEMDCDFSHDPARLPGLVEAAASADLVLGSRYVPGGGVARWGPLRRAVSRGGCLYAQLVLGVPVRDLTGGFKCFRREVLEAIPLDEVTAAGYGFQIEMTYRALREGFRVVEVPIVFTERERGRSKMSRGIVWEAASLVPRLRWRLRGERRVERRDRVGGAQLPQGDIGRAPEVPGGVEQVGRGGRPAIPGGPEAPGLVGAAEAAGQVGERDAEVPAEQDRDDLGGHRVVGVHRPDEGRDTDLAGL